MITISATGRLGKDPHTFITSSTKRMAVAPMACDVGRDRGVETMWLDIVTFGKAADTLMELNKGDMVSTIGRLEISRWTDEASGESRRKFQLIATQLFGARTTQHTAMP